MSGGLTPLSKQSTKTSCSDDGQTDGSVAPDNIAVVEQADSVLRTSTAETVASEAVDNDMFSNVSADGELDEEWWRKWTEDPTLQLSPEEVGQISDSIDMCLSSDAFFGVMC